MARYRAQITVEFETKANVPDMSLTGTIDEVEGLLDQLPNLEDDEANAATATMRVERVL